MREKGELDTQIYNDVKKNMAAVKIQDNVPRDFPAKADEIKYPENGQKVGSLLYRTSNMGYGVQKPVSQDLPSNLPGIIISRQVFPKASFIYKDILRRKFPRYWTKHSLNHKQSAFI